MADWVCSHCEAEVDDGFEVCWQCGTGVDGDENQEFVREVDAAMLPPNHVRTIQCDDCGYRGKILLGRYQYQVWAYLVTPLLVLSLIGIPILFLWLRFTQLLRFKICPKCRSDQIHDWDGEIAPENEQLWSAKQQFEIERSKKNRMRILYIVLATLLCVGAPPLAAWLLHG